MLGGLRAPGVGTRQFPTNTNIPKPAFHHQILLSISSASKRHLPKKENQPVPKNNEGKQPQSEESSSSLCWGGLKAPGAGTRQFLTKETAYPTTGESFNSRADKRARKWHGQAEETTPLRSPRCGTHPGLGKPQLYTEEHLDAIIDPISLSRSYQTFLPASEISGSFPLRPGVFFSWT